MRAPTEAGGGSRRTWILADFIKGQSLNLADGLHMAFLHVLEIYDRECISHQRKIDTRPKHLVSLGSHRCVSYMYTHNPKPS